MRLAVVAAGFTPGEADQLRRAMGAWRKTGVIEQVPGQAARPGWPHRGYTGRFAEAGVQADPRVRRVRLPGVARRVVRAAGLRLGVAQVPLPGGLLRGAAQQPADGLLRPGAARRGRQAARRRGPAGGREPQRVGLHPGAREAASRRCRPRLPPDPRAGPAAPSTPSSGPAATARSGRSPSSPAAPGCGPRPQAAGRGRRLRVARPGPPVDPVEVAAGARPADGVRPRSTATRMWPTCRHWPRWKRCWPTTGRPG